MSKAKHSADSFIFLWEDTRDVTFDQTVMFGHGYDFEGLEHMREEADTPIGRFMVWPDHLGGGKWNLYGGDMFWYQQGFDNSDSAKAEVERFACAIAKAKGDA